METNGSAVVLDRKSLSDVMPLLAMVAPKKSSIPVITHVKLSAQNGEMAITATDLEMGVVTRLPRKGEAALEAVIPAVSFGKYVRLSAGEEVSMAPSDGHGLTLDGTSTFVGLDPVDFPAIPQDKGEPIAVLKACELAEAIDTVEFAISTETVRYALTGMLLDLQAKTAVAAASDGKRLAMHVLHRSKRTSRCRVIVPAKCVRMLARLCDLAGADALVEVSIEYLGGSDGAPREPKTIHFQVGGAWVYSKLIDGNFPAVRAVIPNHTCEGWTFDRKGLIEALKAVRQATTDKTRAVRFRIKDGRCELYAKTQDVGDARAEVAVQGAGGGESCLNPDFVLEYLSSLPKAVTVVGLKFEDSKQAASWHALEGHVYVVMPLTANLDAPK